MVLVSCGIGHNPIHIFEGSGMKKICKKFNRLSFMNCLKEAIGLKLYYNGRNYFYAWNANHAIKKMTTDKLYIINDYGEKIEVTQ